MVEENRERGREHKMVDANVQDPGKQTFEVLVLAPELGTKTTYQSVWPAYWPAWAARAWGELCLPSRLTCMGVFVHTGASMLPSCSMASTSSTPSAWLVALLACTRIHGRRCPNSDLELPSSIALE